MLRLWPVSVILVSVAKLCSTGSQPHIILILADDLGFNDLSFRGSDIIPTPNIDALAYGGRILNRHYVLPICTPSRSALLTGIYPIYLGTQGDPLKGGQRGGAPLDFKFLPEYLKLLGYSTHMAGKWHLGYQTSDFTPIRRGFDSFLGYYNGYMDYYMLDHNQSFVGGEFFGYDMHDGSQPSWDLKGQYATDIFTQRAQEVIEGHNSSTPLFLYLSHLAAHTGAENGDGMQTPPGVDAHQRFSYIQTPERRNYAAVVQALDESVGQVVKSLADANMLNNSIILFLADNGAPSVATDMQPNFGSNWPLRGVKFTLYEGGVRGGAVLWGASIPGQIIDDQTFHITDWTELFILLAGGRSENKHVSGLLKHLKSKKSETTPRDILLNLNEVTKSEAVLLDSRWKVIRQQGHQYGNYDHHIGVQNTGDHVPQVTPDLVRNSKAGKALQDLGAVLDDTTISFLRQEAKINCTPDTTYPMGTVKPSNNFLCKDYCVFDILEDPCELTPLDNPDILVRGKQLLDYYRTLAVPQNQNGVDRASDPALFGGVWTPWLDTNTTSRYLSSEQTNIICASVVGLLMAPVFLTKLCSPIL